jgi:hypothetical protein
MKVFIGTLHCNEADYEQCKSAIDSQKNVSITHATITNLPELEAHNKLWDLWRFVKQDYDLFIKIDADTVLCNEFIVHEICKIFASNQDITGLQAPLHDYFTDSFINGLNCFSPAVTFLTSKDSLYCDRKVDVDHKITISSNQVPACLKPAGLHCHFASDEQAFHFGLHRALKNQNEILQRVKSAHAIYNDRKRKLVLLGSEASKAFKNGNFNYTDEQFRTSFEEALKVLNANN